MTDMLTKRLILLIFLLVAGFAHAQEPIIFKVKKPETKIYISPPGDVLWVGRDNPINITSDNKITIAKVEVAGAKVICKDNNNYIIQMNGFTDGAVTPVLNGTKGGKPAVDSGSAVTVDSVRSIEGISVSYGNETVLSVYEQLPGGGSQLVFTKKYRVSGFRDGMNVEFD